MGRAHSIPFSETRNYVQHHREHPGLPGLVQQRHKARHRSRHPPRRQRELMTASAVSRFVTAPDGLRLHVREYGERGSRHLPVVCLPGLSRTAEDFDVLASAIAADATTPRRVLALDYRGRGLSDHHRNPKNYPIPVELADVIAVLVALGAAPAIIAGTSRGGLPAMALAPQRPGLVAGAVLNDIGPVIASQGLMRIKDYVGSLPAPRTFNA